MNKAFFWIFFLLFCFGSSAYAQHPIDNIVELLNHRELTTAKKLLSENLVHNAEDMDSRLLLGSLTDYFGDSEDAIKIWSEGLRNTEDDYPFYLNIGEIRFRQGIKGMNVKFRKGKVELLNQADSAKDADYKFSMLKLASEAFEKAHILHPYEDEPLIHLGKLHDHLKNYDKSMVFWAKLTEMYPSHEEYWVRLGNAALNLHHYDKAIFSFNHALELNPNYSPAYDGLSDYWLALGNIEQAELATQQGAFYNWLPSFCEMEYSKENYRIYELINFGGEKMDSKGKEKAVRSLLQDKSPTSTKFLATVCYYHEVHGELEKAIVRELVKRDKFSLYMLIALARHTEYLCTIDHVLKELMQVRPAGMLDLLVELLEKDQLEEETIRIAEYMGELGNEQAVLPLIDLLNPTFQSSLENGHLGEIKARQRAALALANFPNAYVIKTLESGLGNPEISAYCAASLYKITLDEKYLKVVALKRKEPTIAFFLKKIETKEAQKLAKKLD
ncbi:tetratricopeptide repeat protein [Thermoflexibacter ruber]|uniref:Tetratricopeptide repeat-containing protein n=1 Tax=Thermoflexibacter ruber TaxID=1003 RepID=A0A1I2I8G1_9BACT|nr:tetratricopeptide repeat protein [Thermoflexibacter ruber]SFF37948.1 Tetratricopeptide repeat-containing protein [Thermoflexibacter ruber]